MSADAKPLTNWQLRALKCAVPQWNLPHYFGCSGFAIKDLVRRGLMESTVLSGVHDGRPWSGIFYRVTPAGVEAEQIANASSKLQQPIEA